MALRYSGTYHDRIKIGRLSPDTLIMYVHERIDAITTITMVRATHRCIRGSRVPAHRISLQRPQWEGGA